MNQVNAIIDVNVRDLHARIKTIHARVGAEFVADLYNVPDDCEDVVFRVSSDGGFFDFPCRYSPSGIWTCRILGMAFRRAGWEWYELRAVSCCGNDTALGSGKILIDEWSSGTATTLDARRRYVMTIADEQGAQHPIFAVKNDIGEWTFELADAADANIPTVAVTQLPAADGTLIDFAANNI